MSRGAEERAKKRCEMGDAEARPRVATTRVKACILFLFFGEVEKDVVIKIELKVVYLCLFFLPKILDYQVSWRGIWG